MKKDEYFLEQWLAGLDSDQEHLTQDIWDPGFAGDRRVVITRLGPYNRIFQRPQRFTKRFYHTVYLLPVAEWQVVSQTKLYGGFCTIDSTIDILFQTTVKYAEANQEFLPDINAHIKACYEAMIKDVIDRELLNLDDGDWIQSGLRPTEKLIETAVNETLMLQGIQCRAICALRPTFEEIHSKSALDGQFTQESIYLRVLQKNFEFREKQKLEKFRQEEELEKLRLEHKQSQLQQLNRDDEIDRQKQLQEAENMQRLQLEKEQQQAELFAMEQRVQNEKIQHQRHLQEMEQEAEVISHEQQLLNEQKMHNDKLNHSSQLKEKELEAEIAQLEIKQAEWNKAKERLNEEKLSQEQRFKEKEQDAERALQQRLQLEEQKAQELLLKEKIEHEKHLQEINLEAEEKAHEMRYAATQKTDEYLRREIELLVLEKQRAELSQEIRKAEQEADDSVGRG